MNLNMICLRYSGLILLYRCTMGEEVNKCETPWSLKADNA
jgi:hypothetical protein